MIPARASMNLDELNFDLPPERIAQHPLATRDASRMLLLDKITGAWYDRHFREFPDLLRGDELIILNNARVLPARLFGRRVGIHAEPPGIHNPARQEHLRAPIEVLLVRQLSPDTWETLVRPGRKISVGEKLIFGEGELEAITESRGEYGLRNKREVWRVQLTLSKIRRAARYGIVTACAQLKLIFLPSQLLTLDEKDPKRLFEGNALIRRLVRVGVLDESRMKLDYVLALKVEDFLERRLQTCVYKLGLAKSIHHARVLIKQRHIRVGKQIVNVPSFVVRLDSQKHIDFALTSPLGGGRHGRVKRKKDRAAEKKEEGGDEAEEEE